MSLINQMLQDLEQRSVGGLQGSGMHTQVRAAPMRKRVHPAWWLVLLLSLLLVGVGIWMWTHPAQPQRPNSELALKIAQKLDTLPSPVAQAPLAPESTAVSAPAPLSATVSTPITAPEPVAPAKAAPDVTDTPPLSPSPRAAETRLPAREPAMESTKAVSKSSAEAEQAKQADLTKKVKELTPQQKAENEFNKASLALQAGRQAEAMSSLELAVKLDPKHAAARQTLVGLMLQAKRNDDALHLVQDGLVIDPAQVGLIMILARIQLEQSGVKTALGTLEHGLPYAGTHAEYHAFMAALLQREKRNKEAIEQYTVALTAAPQTGVWWIGLGISLQAENHLPEAREAFSRARSSANLTPELLAFVDQKLIELK